MNYLAKLLIMILLANTIISQVINLTDAYRLSFSENYVLLIKKERETEKGCVLAIVVCLEVTFDNTWAISTFANCESDFDMYFRISDSRKNEIWPQLTELKRITNKYSPTSNCQLNTEMEDENKLPVFLE
jgi:hypothetical protein